MPQLLYSYYNTGSQFGNNLANFGLFLLVLLVLAIVGLAWDHVEEKKMKARLGVYYKSHMRMKSPPVGKEFLGGFISPSIMVFTFIGLVFIVGSFLGLPDWIDVNSGILRTTLNDYIKQLL